ncbi:MAG TPA: RnfABCDGE type electron transport complex subunit D, partial [Tepidisphaeraceae bacterium]|nr:RnfABCDGE type electron transport complex subunit D [Tepidisphaeraceae bacterium]
MSDIAPMSRSELAIARSGATRERILLPSVRTFARARVLATVPLLLASILVFGWRAILLFLYTLLACWAAGRLWRWVTKSLDKTDSWRTPAVLIALAIPTSAAALPFETVAGSSRFIVPAAAMLFFLASLLRSHVRRPIIDPIVLTLLILHVGFSSAMNSRNVLSVDMLGMHNLFDNARAPLPSTAWVRDVGSGPVIERSSAAVELDRYLGARHDSNGVGSVSQLLLERMPPLEDLVIGGHPGPMGQVGAIYALAGMLVMSWRGVADLRTPLIFLAGFYFAVLLLPIPGVIRPDSIELAWPAIFDATVGIEAGLTFANYVLLASPAVFASCFIATLSDVSPIARGARLFWSLVAGVGSAIATLYFDVSAGVYLALLVAGMLSPWFDWMFGP